MGGAETHIGRAYLCRLAELAEITDEAARYAWSARLDRQTLERGVDAANLHLIVPFLVNGQDAGVPPSFRSYLWFKHANENKRSCVVIDVSEARLQELPRPSVNQCDRLICMLVEQLPIQFVDPFRA
jgi:hypothetical protein